MLTQLEICNIIISGAQYNEPLVVQNYCIIDALDGVKCPKYLVYSELVHGAIVFVAMATVWCVRKLAGYSFIHGPTLS